MAEDKTLQEPYKAVLPLVGVTSAGEGRFFYVAKGLTNASKKPRRTYVLHRTLQRILRILYRTSGEIRFARAGILRELAATPPVTLITNRREQQVF